MKISELIELLQNALSLYGDLRVLTDGICIDCLRREESLSGEMCLDISSTEPWRNF